MPNSRAARTALLSHHNCNGNFPRIRQLLSCVSGATRYFDSDIVEFELPVCQPRHPRHTILRGAAFTHVVPATPFWSRALPWAREALHDTPRHLLSQVQIPFLVSRGCRVIVLLELRQSSQGISAGGFKSSHHLSGRDDITNDTDANFSSLGEQVSYHAEGEALGII